MSTQLSFTVLRLISSLYLKRSWTNCWNQNNLDICLILMKWIETIHSMTEYDVLKQLSKFLDKLFEILSSNGKHDVYDVAFSQLKLFLIDYEKWKSRSIQIDVNVLHKILGFLNKRKNIDIEKSRLFAIIWLEEFIKYFKQDLEVMRNDSRSHASDFAIKEVAKEERKLSKNKVIFYFLQTFILIIF